MMSCECRNASSGWRADVGREAIEHLMSEGMLFSTIDDLVSCLEAIDLATKLILISTSRPHEQPRRNSLECTLPYYASCDNKIYRVHSKHRSHDRRDDRICLLIHCKDDPTAHLRIIHQLSRPHRYSSGRTHDQSAQSRHSPLPKPQHSFFTEYPISAM